MSAYTNCINMHKVYIVDISYIQQNNATPVSLKNTSTGV